MGNKLRRPRRSGRKPAAQAAEQTFDDLGKLSLEDSAPQTTQPTAQDRASTEGGNKQPGLKLRTTGPRTRLQAKLEREAADAAATACADAPPADAPAVREAVHEVVEPKAGEDATSTPTGEDRAAEAAPDALTPCAAATGEKLQDLVEPTKHEEATSTIASREHAQGDVDAQPVGTGEEESKGQEVSGAGVVVAHEEAPPVPSAKEIAAAKAARIRLGLEENDGSVPMEVSTSNVPSGPEPAVVDLKYPSREELEAVEAPEEYAQTLPAALASKQWLETIDALNGIRRLAVHHPDVCKAAMPNLRMPLLKMLKSPRSGVIKTAVLCTSDLLISLRTEMLPHLDVGGGPAASLLCALLTKAASNDKKFVLEAVSECLGCLCHVPGSDAAAALLPYCGHKNPRLRAQAATHYVAAIARLSQAEQVEYGLDRLLKSSGSMATDNTPTAREAGRKLAQLVAAAFASSEALQAQHTAPPAPADEVPEGDEPTPPPPTPWEAFCKASLSPSQAGVVVKMAQA